jgi:hypothetical protein
MHRDWPQAKWTESDKWRSFTVHMLSVFIWYCIILKRPLQNGLNVRILEKCSSISTAVYNLWSYAVQNLKVDHGRDFVLLIRLLAQNSNDDQNIEPLMLITV